MISIDEAIQRENKIAEENQKIVDTEIIFDDVSLSQLYCDDTEVIEEHLENYKKCAEYHKQLAKWLEDYKRLKELFSTCEQEIYQKAYKKGQDKGFSDGHFFGYNKAIDDFAEKLKPIIDEKIKGWTNSDDLRRWCERSIDEIAEQLKASEKNE